jgi:hypothetical protein
MDKEFDGAGYATYVFRRSMIVIAVWIAAAFLFVILAK